MNRALTCSLWVAMVACVGLQARADEAPARTTPTRHQLMKECMAKQKASDGGIPKEEMKKNCRDITKTENENAKAEKESAGDAATAPRP